MTTIIIFVLILGLLVLVHELGHFIVARRNGITAHEFGFGFPPRLFGVYVGDDGKRKIIWGGKHAETNNTIYSINWLPIGGFVKIKGEDGSEKNEKDSFASKTAWTRSKVLLAGVTMNFVLAWILLSAVFMIGSDEDVTGMDVPGSRIIVTAVVKDSPAEMMGLKMGDEIISGKRVENIYFKEVTDVQNFIGSSKGEEVTLEIKRSDAAIELKGTPRAETVEGQGPLGINLAKVSFVKHPFFESLYLGLVEMGNILIMMWITITELIFGKASNVDITGIVGIAVYTGQIIPLGFVQILKFVAILSLNLGLINALPFPALDGGRVLFILIEKLKGSPVSEKIEHAIHATGMILLITLMVFVTFKDIVKFDILGKMMGIF